MSDYQKFVAEKLVSTPPTGIVEVPPLNESCFPHQRDLISWALRRGRAAIFADTGLGKTACEVEWARCVADHTGGRVLILAPLAVAAQTVREAERIGVLAKQVRYGGDVEDEARIVVTNYDRLHHFDPSKFAGVVLDESGILKSFDGKTTKLLTETFADHPFRLCATATPSPNDYTELGTHAEFLGICTRQEMLAEYFVNDASDTKTWRLKGHARALFWKWLATWGALIRKPSDLGHSNAGYDLPELRVTQHTIAADPEQVKAQGLLFAEPAKTLTERRAAKRSTVNARVRQCADLVMSEPGQQWLVWCELNAESEALADAISGAVEIRGADDALVKERRLLAFASGELRVLVTKVRIAGYGMNFQSCARMAFVGVNDSYEQFYQAIRRCWRFGQKRPVEVHIFASELEGEVVKNLLRKEQDAKVMGEELSAETREAVRAEVQGQTRQTIQYKPGLVASAPAWLGRRSA